MPTNVLLTGAYGRVGTAIIEHLADREEYAFTYLDVEDHPDHDTVVADVRDVDAIRPAFDGQDAVVHLAGEPSPSAPWETILEQNVIGTYNVMEAAREAGVESVVFASTNHVVGMYEIDDAPALYQPGFGRVIDHRDPVRPDSYYGVSKLFGEHLGRYYVEDREAPRRFYALRIAYVLPEEYDHPYGPAELGVDRGDWERGSEAYEEAVAYGRAIWCSRRDLARMVDAALRDDSVSFDIFYAVSDNHRRWFDLEHARAVVGFDPQDDGEEWDAPPS